MISLSTGGRPQLLRLRLLLLLRLNPLHGSLSAESAEDKLLCLATLWSRIIGKQFLHRQRAAKVSINLLCASINISPQERHDLVFDYYQPLPALDLVS